MWSAAIQFNSVFVLSHVIYLSKFFNGPLSSTDHELQQQSHCPVAGRQQQFPGLVHSLPATPNTKLEQTHPGFSVQPIAQRHPVKSIIWSTISDFSAATNGYSMDAE
jgi:hypothetical protein